MEVTENKFKNRKQSFDTNSNIMFGKLPPQSLELEETVLGAMMLDKDATTTGLEILKEECFYNENNRLIFKSMVNLVNKKIAIDLLTVSEELRSMESLEQIGGVYFLATLTESIASTAHIEYWCKIVLEKFVQRELIRASNEIINESYQPDVNVLELINSAESKLFNITNNFIKNNYQKVADVLVGVMDRITKLRENKGSLSGVSSGFKSLDSLTNGWQKTDLIVMAARPGMGKTAVALNLLRNAAMHNANPIPTALFSLEMGMGQIIERLLSAESEIDLKEMKNGRLNDAALNRLYTRGLEPLSNAPIYIDETPGINIFELRSKCQKLVNHHGVGLIIIDYLQLMSVDDIRKTFNREQEISKLSRNLKALAKELNIPIITLSQLNRQAEGRKDHIPMLSDLRESGAIEQDADMVIFLHRPDYYNNTQNELGEDIKGLTEIIIAKHRNGELGSVKLKANLEIQKFSEWEQNNYTNSSTIVQKFSSKMNQNKTDDNETPF